MPDLPPQHATMVDGGQRVAVLCSECNREASVADQVGDEVVYRCGRHTRKPASEMTTAELIAAFEAAPTQAEHDFLVQLVDGINAVHASIAKAARNMDARAAEYDRWRAERGLNDDDFDDYWRDEGCAG